MDEDLSRQRAKNKLLILLAALVAALAIAIVALWYFSRPSVRVQVSSLESALGGAMIKEVQESVSAPAPLIATGTNASASAANSNADILTRAGIIAATNMQRNENGGLGALSENALLDQIASERLDDMAAKQYFAHVSPSSSSAETVAAADGYDHIALGENLALGDFAGDAGVVAAWMGSPGHRANILNVHYTEIGVAAQKIIFDGEETWLAVQIFGRPASDCPAPDAATEAALNSTETQLAGMEKDLSARQAAINALPPSDASYGSDVAAYNALATEYNDLLSGTKSNIAAYNAEVATYNACLEN